MSSNGGPPTHLAAALAIIQEQGKVIEDLQKDVRLLRERLRAQARGRFGRSCERFESPGQLGLFGNLVEESPEQPKPETPAGKPKPKRKRRRLGFPAGLERREEVQETPEEDRLCDCCDPPRLRVVIGHEKTELLEYVPSQLFVKVTIREKLACPTGKGSVVTPLVEPRILPKARVGVSLLAFILLSKYQDHLPLYRIHKILKRQGMDVAESTLCDWVGGVTDALAPLVLLMKNSLLKAPYLQADETPAKARAPDIKGKNVTVYFWVYCLPWEEVIFDYRRTREGKWPVEFLDGWEGKLQVDDYRGYDGLFEGALARTRVGCMAHARRKFHEAKHDRPVECNRVLGWTQWMFKIETLMRHKGRSPEWRRAVRQRFFRGILDKILELVEEGLGDPTVLPGSPYEKAIKYAKRNWETLLEFLEDGTLEMDNNSAENAIRPFAIGRKNWLQIGHVSAGDRAAVMYSLLTTCQRLGINPHDYLTDVLTRLPAHPVEDQWQLTPRGWLEARSQASHQEASSEAV